MKQLINVMMDCLMLALVFFGLYQGNVYAENVLWFLMLIFGAISVIMIFAITNDEVKSKFKQDRVTRGKVARAWSVTSDIVFCVLLASIGFVITAAIWFIIQMLVYGNINKIDDEIMEERSAKKDN